MPTLNGPLLRQALTVATVSAAILLGPQVRAETVQLDAKADFDASFVPTSRSFSGSYLAGRLAGSDGDAPAAAEFYRRALAGDPESQALLDRAFVLSLVSGDVKEAIDLGARLLDEDETHLLARLSLAAEAIKSGRIDEAAQLMDEAGQGPLAELTTTLFSAWIDQAKGDTDGAIATIEGLQGPDWYSVFKPYHIGLVVAVAGREEQAGEAFEAAYAADPGALRVAQAWTRHLMANGKQEEARAVVEEFAQRLPNHPLVAQLRANVEEGNTPEPLVTSVADGVAELLYGLGSALGSDSAEEYAASYIQLSLYLWPDNALARFALADFYERLKDFDAAAAAYEGVAQGSLLRDTADVHRALVLNAAEKPEEAQKLLREVLDRRPEAMDALVALGNILRSREEFADAAQIYSRAIEIAEAKNEENWTLYYFRGIANERTKNWDQAEADLKKALELEPGQPLVLNYLGYSWIDHGNNLEEGLAMIQQAVDARPNDGFIVDSLGWAYYKLGRYEEAVEHLERAVELMPQEGVINDHLGDAYWKVGRKLEAKFQWSHALDQDLSDEPGLKEEIQAKLKDGLTEEPEPSSAVASESDTE